ncbi:MAG TPA: glycoside hydrolase family 20 zincin-like fold domain-containing protein [Blastocatellia bacterium]|nr:glycoside hydrolase family 20 zincin-like fold domain-containing protein [Blastocatellia bacterium]
MMKRKSLWIVPAAIILLSATSAFAQDLKLIPEPKQVERRAGAFAITSKTRIVVNSAHTEEDRAAAETLGEEIERATGRKVAITTSRSLPKANAIYLARVGDDARLSAALAADKLAIDDKLDEEGYVIDASAERIVVAARTGAGVFYGAQTLRQLLGQGSGAQAGETRQLSCPAVAIKDWPQMRWRGVHDDISRGPVPTLEYMKRQVRTCAAFKLNLFSLYLEHVFDYQSQPLIAPKEGAITAADVKELVEYARRYYVTILPEQQAFGHLHHVLKYETFSDMAETPHGHVLAPVNDKTYAFIKDLYAELVPLFPGPLFHIGADETFELGRGQTKAHADQVGLGRVYLEHLKRVAEIMKPYNKRLMFWGDIAMKYPELLGILPKDVIAVAWGYSPQPAFDNLLKPYKDAHLDLFVAPGASNWNRIFPNLDAAFLNIRNFVRDGQKYGALGMLNTTWDDDGEALFQMTWPAVAFGAACAWQSGESSIERFKANYDWAFYRNEDHVFRDALQSLSRAHSILRDAKLGDANDEPFWSDPFTETGAAYVEKAEAAAHDLRIEAERALASLYRHREQARNNDDTIDSLIFAGLRLDALGMKAQLVGEISRYYWEAYLNMSNRQLVQRNLSQIAGANGRLEDLRDATTRLREMYAKLWMAENRAYWLANVTVRYDNLARLFVAKAQTVRQAMQQYREQGTLPTPQQMGFFIRVTSDK